MSLRLFATAFALLVAVAGFARADDIKLGPLVISDPWTRATPPKAPSAGGYLTIANTGTEADRLVSVASPEAGSAQLHQMQMKDGVMTMREVTGGIHIPAGGTVTLAPDGLHIMFVKLKSQLKPGGTFPATLTFAKAGSVDVGLPILPLGARGPSAGAAGGTTGSMDMNGMGGMKMDQGK